MNNFENIILYYSFDLKLLKPQVRVGNEITVKILGPSHYMYVKTNIILFLHMRMNYSHT